MATIAVYSLKGGVGKTTISVNLAYAAAMSGHRSLLWDLDPQGGATFLTGLNPRQAARKIFAKDTPPEKLIRATAWDNLDVLPADASLRGLDRIFDKLGKKRRLAKLTTGLARTYDRIILDCPPGLTETSEQVMRAADLIVVPVIPSPLSRRALDEVQLHLSQKLNATAELLPVWSMVDRRRSLHRDVDNGWPCVPMASVVEQMAVRRMPLGAIAPKGAAHDAFADLRRAIEERLAR